MPRSDAGLRTRLLKHEGNNVLRVQAFVVRLSKCSDEELRTICGLKMCNKRRAAEKLLAWRQSKLSEPLTTAGTG